MIIVTFAHDLWLIGFMIDHGDGDNDDDDKDDDGNEDEDPRDSKSVLKRDDWSSKPIREARAPLKLRLQR